MAKTPARNGHAPDNRHKKHVLKRAKNGRRRDKSIGMTFYDFEREDIKRLARRIAREHGYGGMSYASLLKWLAFQDWL